MIVPATGGAVVGRATKKAVRLVRYGCANRPFYHIVVMAQRKYQHAPVIEQLGHFDPMPNERNEKLIGINFERLRFWVGSGVSVTRPVAELLGLAGFFPIYPRTYRKAWKTRLAAKKAEEAAAEGQEDIKQKENAASS